MSSLVFFGTGQTSLDALVALAEDFEIEAVITKPDAVDSSGKARASLVASWGVEHNLPIFKPANKAELSTLFAEKRFASPVGVVLDYGVIIPEDVIDSFEYEIVNSHFSLLPHWRGADPIRAAILAGDKTTGVTIMQIVPELDAGPILTWAETGVRADITEPELRDELSELNCSLLPETLKLYLDDQINTVAQDVTEATITKKVSKADGLLDPAKSAVDLEREIRAYITWPKSYFLVQNTQITIKKANVADVKVDQGKLEVRDKKLYFGTSEGSLEILELQPAGKAPMDATSFINGYKGLIE